MIPTQLQSEHTSNQPEVSHEGTSAGYTSNNTRAEGAAANTKKCNAKSQGKKKEKTESKWSSAKSCSDIHTTLISCINPILVFSKTQQKRICCTSLGTFHIHTTTRQPPQYIWAQHNPYLLRPLLWQLLWNIAHNLVLSSLKSYRLPVSPSSFYWSRRHII